MSIEYNSNISFIRAFLAEYNTFIWITKLIKFLFFKHQ